jgi:hypothetical protein
MTAQNLLIRMSDQHKARMMGCAGHPVGKDFESGCAGRAWDALGRRPDLAVPQIQMLGARQNDEHLSGRRRLAKALDLAVSPRPAADCPGLDGAASDTSAIMGASRPLTWGKGNSRFSFA